MTTTMTQTIENNRTPSADELSNCFSTVNAVAAELHRQYISGTISREEYYNNISELYSGLVSSYLAVVHGLPKDSGTFYFDAYLKAMRPEWF